MHMICSIILAVAHLSDMLSLIFFSMLYVFWHVVSQILQLENVSGIEGKAIKNVSPKDLLSMR